MPRAEEPGEQSGTAHPGVPPPEPPAASTAQEVTHHQYIKSHYMPSGSKHKRLTSKFTELPIRRRKINRKLLPLNFILNIFQESEIWVRIPLSLRCQNLLLMEKVKSM